MPRIPLIEDLTTGPVPSGSNLLAEFDPNSQWYNASISIMAGWLRTGGKVTYGVAAQPVEKVRAKLKGLGLDSKQLENDGRLQLSDWYSMTLGKKSGTHPSRIIRTTTSSPKNTAKCSRTVYRTTGKDYSKWIHIILHPT